MNENNNSGERLAKIETKIEHIQESVGELKEQIQDLNNKLDISNFVKKDDPSYFNDCIQKYEQNKLNKTNTITSIWNNIYKLIIAVAGVVVIFSNLIK